LIDVVSKLAPEMVPSPLIFPAQPPPPVEVFDILKEADRTWVAGKLTSTPTQTLVDKLRVSGAFARVPRNVFIGVSIGEKSFFEAIRKRYAGDPAWRMHRLDCGHEAMIDRPDALATILMDSI